MKKSYYSLMYRIIAIFFWVILYLFTVNAYSIYAEDSIAPGIPGEFISPKLGQIVAGGETLKVSWGLPESYKEYYTFTLYYFPNNKYDSNDEILVATGIKDTSYYHTLPKNNSATASYAVKTYNGMYFSLKKYTQGYFIVDSTPPEVELIVKAGEEDYLSGSWTKNDIEVKLNGRDNLTGFKIMYKLDEEEEWHYGISNSSVEMNLKEEGMHILFYRAVDEAGNLSEMQSLDINVDKTPPTITSTKAFTGTEKNSIQIDITAIDEGSGLCEFPYSFDGENTWIAENNIIMNDIEGNNKSYDISVSVKDKMGNIISKTVRAFTLADDPMGLDIVSISKDSISFNIMEGNNVIPPDYRIEIKKKGAGLSGAIEAASDFSKDTEGRIISGLVLSEEYEAWVITRNNDGVCNEAVKLIESIQIPHDDNDPPVDDLQICIDNPSSGAILNKNSFPHNIYTIKGRVFNAKNDVPDISVSANNIIKTIKDEVIYNREKGLWEVQYTIEELGEGRDKSVNATIYSGDEFKTVKADNISIDVTKPTIVLNGSSSIIIEQNSNYIDEGAVATDNLDGDLSSSIVATNYIDTSKIGTYTITYNVSDSSGNNADEVKRIVHVIKTNQEEEKAKKPPKIQEPQQSQKNYLNQVLINGKEKSPTYIVKDSLKYMSLNSDSDEISVLLSGSSIVESINSQTIFEINTKYAKLVLPSWLIKINEAANEFAALGGINEISVQIQITETNEKDIIDFGNKASEIGATIINKPIDVRIKYIYKDKIHEAERFNQYSFIYLPLSECEIDNIRITGVNVGKKDGINHAPTKLITENGIKYARINTLSSGVYSTISYSAQFSDVENHWAKEYINDIASRLIVFSTDGKNISPDSYMTSSEFSQMIEKALGFKPCFASRCVEEEKPGAEGLAELTREEAMVIIHKILSTTMINELSDFETNKEVLKEFKDGNNISEEAKESVAICVTKEIFQGFDCYLRPEAFLTRAEAAAIINRMMKLADLI